MALSWRFGTRTTIQGFARASPFWEPGQRPASRYARPIGRSSPERDVEQVPAAHPRVMDRSLPVSLSREARCSPRGGRPA